jgi:hypothetical protein
MKYRKKPIVIEAFQFKKQVRWQSEEWPEWPEWLQVAGNLRSDKVGALVVVDCDKIGVRTLEGVMVVDWDDYIIQGVQGELYPCKPDIFHATYEEVV